MKKRSWLLASAAMAVALSYPLKAAETAPQPDMSSEISALKARLEQLEIQQKAADQQRQDAERKLDEKITSDSLRDKPMSSIS